MITLYTFILTAVILLSVGMSYSGYGKFRKWRKKCKDLDTIEEAYNSKCN